MMQAYPFEDALVGLLALSLWVLRPETWKVQVAFALLVRIALHTENHGIVTATLAHKKVAGMDDYILGSNILFGVVLLCIARNGGAVLWVGFANRCLRLLGRDAYGVPRSLGSP